MNLLNLVYGTIWNRATIKRFGRVISLAIFYKSDSIIGADVPAEHYMVAVTSNDVASFSSNIKAHLYFLSRFQIVHILRANAHLILTLHSLVVNVVDGETLARRRDLRRLRAIRPIEIIVMHDHALAFLACHLLFLMLSRLVGHVLQRVDVTLDSIRRLKQI